MGLSPYQFVNIAAISAMRKKERCRNYNVRMTVSEIKVNEKDHMQIGQDELKKYLEEQLSSSCKITVIFKDR